MTTWYAIRTHSKREFEVSRDLSSAGYTVFLPVEVVRTKSRHASSHKDTRRPLVTGYLFVAYSPWVDHKYVIGAVMMGSEPVRITDAALVPLYHATGRLVDRTPAAPKARRFLINEIVRVAIGPLAGLKFTITKLARSKVSGDTKLGPITVPVTTLAA